MPRIVPIRDLKNTTAISTLCHEEEEPIFVTKNGYGDMVLMSMETYEKNMAYNVRIMEKAEQDLSEIVTYFTEKLCNPRAAESLLEEFLEEKNNISDNP